MYTSTNLPPFKPDTSGIAHPKPGAPIAVCVAPAAATIKRPATWGAGQALVIDKGAHHVAQDSEGDSYPNKEFLAFYRIGERLSPATDPRAAFLAGFWAGQGEEGFAVDVFLAEKTREAIVLGEVTDECAGKVFESHEGKTDIIPGSRILQSPDDAANRWLITPQVFDKKYQGVERA